VGVGGAVAEVLDVTHDHNSPFKLHFDDVSWKQHLSSLKPLGLAILLNTCNANSQVRMLDFLCCIKQSQFFDAAFMLI